MLSDGMLKLVRGRQVQLGLGMWSLVSFNWENLECSHKNSDSADEFTCWCSFNGTDVCVLFGEKLT